jgi:hypothetical protein
MPDITSIYREQFLKRQSKFLYDFKGLFQKAIHDSSYLVNNPNAKFAKAWEFCKYPPIDKELTAIIGQFNKNALSLNVNAISESWNFANKKDDEIVKTYLSTLKNIKAVSQNPALSKEMYNPNTGALKAFISRTHGK